MDAGVLPHFGQEHEFTTTGKIGDRPAELRHWKLARLTMAVWGKIWPWVKERLPDPFDGLDRIIDKLDPGMASKLISDARHQAIAMNSLESDEAKALLATLEGQVWSFWAQLSVNHPDVTPDEALDILLEVGRGEVAKMRKITEGEMPPAGKGEAPAA
jgi:hypothetical protein